MVWGAIGGDAGFSVGAALVVVDAQRDLGDGRGDRSHRGGESEDHGCDVDGELHFDGWIDVSTTFV